MDCFSGSSPCLWEAVFSEKYCCAVEFPVCLFTYADYLGPVNEVK